MAIGGLDDIVDTWNPLNGHLNVLMDTNIMKHGY